MVTANVFVKNILKPMVTASRSSVQDIDCIGTLNLVRNVFKSGLIPYKII